MGVDRRRAGFRLPWTADGEQTQDAQDPGANAGADAAARAEMEAPPSSEGAMTMDVAEQPADDGAAADSTTADSTTATDDGPETTTEASAETATGAESADFLASLVGAMRGVAESSRDASLAELRTVIDQRIVDLNSQASERERTLRSTADTDIEAVGEWERSETDRIRAEAETKRDERRARLEQELSEHHAASERAAADARSRLAQHERDLAAFFSQLGEITDPAAFVAAAKRMPRPPDLDAAAANVSSSGATASSDAPAEAAAIDPRLAALGVTGDEPEATDDTAASDQSNTTESAVAEPASASNGTTPPGDAQLAERLAQLDERLAASPAQSPAPATAAGGDASTAIVVKGLGSFGAITSFKQALERVEGIRGVTLSLGPTGEFVYRASHASEYDLVAAIQALEGPTASIDATDGTLVVTLSRAR